MAAVRLVVNGDPQRPNFNQQAVYIHHLKAYVDVGTYLLLNPCHERYNMSLCRLLDFLRIGLTETFRLSVQMYRVEDGSLVEGNHNTQSRYMDIAIPTSETWQVEVQDVNDICFLFRVDDLEEQVFTAQGRRDCFVFSDTITTEPESFLCSEQQFRGHSSMARRIWHDQNKMRASMRKMLCSPKEDQSLSFRKSDRVDISMDTWLYCCRQAMHLRNVEMEMNASCKRKTEMFLQPGFHYLSLLRLLSCQKLTFEEEAGMGSFIGMFGEWSTLGIRVKRPKVAEDDPPLNFLEGETIHYASQITLTYADGTVSMSVKYHSYGYETDDNDELLNCPCEHIKNFLQFLAPAMEKHDLYEPPPDGVGPAMLRALRVQEREARQARRRENAMLTAGVKLAYNRRLHIIWRDFVDGEDEGVDLKCVEDGVDEPVFTVSCFTAHSLLVQYLE